MPTLCRSVSSGCARRLGGPIIRVSVDETGKLDAGSCSTRRCQLARIGWTAGRPLKDGIAMWKPHLYPMRTPSVVVLGAFWMALALGCISTSFAQDSHYWTNQYGTRAQLLGGLVVGSLVDLSSTYYNPGAIALVTDPSLMLATAAFQYILIDIDDPLGTGINFRNQRVRPAPGMFATSLPISGLGHNQLAVAMLTRRDFVFEADARRTDDTGVGEAKARFLASENWLGPTWAYPLNETVGLGLTAYLALRSQTARLGLSLQSFDATGAVSNTAVDEFRYWHLRALAKIGVLVDKDPLRLGCTVTTSGLGLAGQGEVLHTRGFVSSESNAGFLVEGHAEKDLASDYRSPWSIAVGASRRFGRAALFASAEWFDSIASYAVLDPDDFVSQSTGDTISVDVERAEAGVVNWGIGLEVDLEQNAQIYAAFYTDRTSSAPIQGATPVSIASWDIFNLNLGGAITFRNTDITAGVSFGFGNDQVDPIVDLSGAGASTRGVRYFSLTLLLGIRVAL